MRICQQAQDRAYPDANEHQDQAQRGRDISTRDRINRLARLFILFPVRQMVEVKPAKRKKGCDQAGIDRIAQQEEQDGPRQERGRQAETLG